MPQLILRQPLSGVYGGGGGVEVGIAACIIADAFTFQVYPEGIICLHLLHTSTFYQKLT